jgi:dipeptidyl aminopeptidase/acylaminoacyl peptidase
MKAVYVFQCLLVVSLVTLTAARAQQVGQSEREAMYYRYLKLQSLVKGGSVRPHWMADGSSFWYAEGDPDNTIIYKVDPEANTKEPLFDTDRVRRALTPLLGHEPPGQGLPFGHFTFVDGEKAVEFAVENRPFILRLDTYTISPARPLSVTEKNRMVPQNLPQKIFTSVRREMEVLSPDGRWFATLREHNLWLRSTSDASSVQLTTDGIEGYEWGYVGYPPSGWYGFPSAKWSADSSQLAVKKLDYRELAKIPLVNWLEPTPEVQWLPYAKAGEPMHRTELYVVDIRSKQQVRLDTGKKRDQYLLICGWRLDGSELLFLRVSRTFRKVELMAADPTTGATRVVLTETYKTFWSAPLGAGGRFFTLLKDGNRFLWMSERDEWKHLYLYDLDGTLIRRLTEGSFPVVKLVAVDEHLGWVYFTAHGDQQRPYDTHLYRVNLEGEGFTRLTEASGQHAIEFSPSKQFFLDTHSTIARPPVVELRSADGKLLRTLSKADIKALTELNWTPPEQFVVKAADGKTDLWGALYKPYDFDPNKKYPVVESIYGGPQTTYVPRTFGRRVSRQALAQLGFIVFIVDGRGTPERGKAFQDVGHGQYSNVIPDHVAALKQLAAQRPYMDLSRVGIYGHSRGGYNTIRALLLVPNVYHVGVASAPMTYWVRFHEAWMGLPQENKEGYEETSNLRWADNLKGKLLLVQGTSDNGALFSDTIKMVDALARAGKPYDLIVLPEAGHRLGRGARYVAEARRRYFQEHLKPVPTVEITRPVEGSFDPGGPMSLKAKASASADARVLRVEFLIDGVPIGVDSEPPYEFNWREAKKGRHVVTAKVYDSTGRMELSPPVTVHIGIQPPKWPVVTRSGDGAEELADGSMYLGSSDLDLIRDDTLGDQVVGIRFADIQILKGTEIKKAYLQFTVDEVSTEQTDLTIHAELADNAEAFRNVDHNITSRPKTSASVKWLPEPWNVDGERSEKQRTPDLSSLIQEVIAQPSWQAGNALVLIISGSGKRVAESYYYGDQQGTPVLYIEY